MSSLKTVHGRWAAAFAAVAISMTAAATPGRAANLIGSFSGNAYASSANVTVGPLAAGLGTSAYIPCPCQGSNGKVQSNIIAGVTAGTVLHLGAASSTTVSSKTTSTAVVTDTSTIAGISLLGGLITADAIKAVATVSATASAITESSAGTGFVNLKVAGQPIDVNVAPNTTITLVGIGSVTLQKVVATTFASSGNILVEMISINVSTANSLGLPVGTKITVGHAQSGFSRVQPAAILGGTAYGASANAAIGSTLQGKIGQVALVTIPCLGTGNKIATNNVNNTSVTGVLSLGASTTTAFGGSQNGGLVARTTATVAGIKLLGSLIGATAITSVAQETMLNGVRSRSTAGTSFAELKILGLTIPLTTAPNTVFALPLLGTVIFNEQTVPTTGGRTIVNGLHVFITGVNLLGLPVGTEIIVAHADASASAF